MGSWILCVYPRLWRSSQSILCELHESHFLHTCVWPLCELCKLWLLSLRVMVGSGEISSDGVNWADSQGSTIWGECRDCGWRQLPGSTESDSTRWSSRDWSDRPWALSRLHTTTPHSHTTQPGCLAADLSALESPWPPLRSFHLMGHCVGFPLWSVTELWLTCDVV